MILIFIYSLLNESVKTVFMNLNLSNIVCEIFLKITLTHVSYDNVTTRHSIDSTNRGPIGVILACNVATTHKPARHMHTSICVITRMLVFACEIIHVYINVTHSHVLLRIEFTAFRSPRAQIPTRNKYADRERNLWAAISSIKGILFNVIRYFDRVRIRDTIPT